MKLETTKKVELIHPANIDQDLRSSQSSVKKIQQPSRLARITALMGNHRNRTSAVMMGLLVLVGISSFPTNSLDTVAVAAESATESIKSGSTANRYVEQLRHDVSAMRARYAPQSSVLVAQAYPLSVGKTDTNNLQFAGEAATPIEVAQPKTRTFKPVATSQPYGYETESRDYDDRSPLNQTGTTTIGFSWPAAGKITSRYGRRWGRMHKGIDIAGPIGTPINAAADGIVIAAGWHPGGYGNLVELRHSDGTTTRYGHNSRLSVAIGQTVRQGQQLAEMGSTGRSTGSHLHFEIRPSGGGVVNPIAHLPTNRSSSYE